ncbi:hypothetical protein ASG50_24550 [Rhizobium sp. Leaf386]|nr:hypothetical protein ASG50_24550 [Rhizobium sp. Leaf386]
MLSTHFYGVVHIMRVALATMREQGSGRIINMTSLAGLVGLESCSAYSAAEFAIEGLSQAVAREVESTGIRITTVALGFFPESLRDFYCTDDASTASKHAATVSKEDIAFKPGKDRLQRDNLADLSCKLLTIAEMTNPPRHFVADRDVFDTYKPILIGRLDELRINEALTRSAGGYFPLGNSEPGSADLKLSLQPNGLPLPAKLD